MRLDKYLADCGIGTRSEVKEIVRKGRVTVNGAVIKDSGAAVSEADSVSVDGKALGGVGELNKKHWFMLNKPAGTVSANSDEKDATVIDIFKKEGLKGLFTVGRLDKDTEGLLLVCDDGEMSHYLLAPSRNIEKVYYAKTDGLLEPDAAERLAAGIEFKEFVSRPAKLEILSEDGDNNTCEAYVTVSEGRFHEVKRLIAAVGGEVTYLKRIAFGPLELDGNLQPGDYRPLTEEEIRLLTEAVKKDKLPGAAAGKG
ncbi:MAG: rRNA pseudouridine synthase [Lachnospiraceae bacterium]|nr:rRNA pseudouridine synthase [Lachnospiraceae bacterium]